MTNINENLQKMLSARYGRDMRQAIHDSIESMSNKIDNTLSDDNMNTVIDEQVRDYLSKNQVVSDEQVEEAVNNYINNNDNSELVKQSNAIGYYYEGHIDASTNIFDMSRVWEGYGINVGNIGGIDTMTESDDVPSGRVYKTSDVSVTTKYKIPCQENDIIRINYNWRTVAFFSEDGEMLVAYNAESYKYTAPANTAYCRVCCAISIKDKFMVTKNKDMPINYEAYQEEVIGKKTFNSIPNLKERVENLEKKTVFDKGAVLFSFDAMNTTDGRFETLNSYGFRATTNGGEVSSIKAQLKSGWDIATYSAVNWVYDTYGEQCLANDISEEIQTAWDNYVKNTVEMYEQKGVYFPTTWFCRQGKFCTGLKNALQKYGYKMARGSYYDNVNITNTTFGNDFCFNTSAFSLYPDSYVKAKEIIDYAVANKVGIVLFSHGIYETEEEATSNYGTTQAILTEICEYIKKYVDNGELEVITYHDLYSRYFPQESRELDYRRTISTLMHDWSVTE